MNDLINNPIFLIPIMVGPIFIIAGLVLLKFPPKNRNILYGYRTQSSMKSPERWKFAQINSGKEAIRSGIILSLFSLLGFVYYPSEIISVLIGLGLMLMTILVMLFRIEKAIARKFNTNNQESIPQSPNH
ncbi:MAG TPA: SdpI family protein [Bacteroidia bacterium]|nr:SdpI family protein [Bacteroidia bacterium]